MNNVKEQKDNSFEKVNQFVTETGGIDYAYRQANSISQQGLDNLAWASNSEYYTCLENMVKFTTSRVV